MSSRSQVKTATSFLASFFLATSTVFYGQYPAFSGTTSCTTHNNDWQIRCAKEDDPNVQHVVVKSKQHNVTFWADFYISACHRPTGNSKYKYDQFSLANPNSIHTLTMETVESGACRELFILDCKVSGQSKPCPEVLSVEVKP